MAAATARANSDGRILTPSLPGTRRRRAHPHSLTVGHQP